MAPLHALLAFVLLSPLAFVAADLLGAQPDGALYITPDMINNCKHHASTANGNRGIAMLLDAVGGVTNVSEPDTNLGDCCPPPSKDAPVAFTPYNQSKPLRVRRSWLDVQNDPAYMAQLATGLALMRKANGQVDPNSLERQAKVHCVHCTTTKLDGFVHGGWHFAPWHRAEIYYFETSLGYLLGDPTFALPYWEWDNPDNKWLIPQYKDSKSSLYDENRTQNETGSIEIITRYDNPTEIYKTMVQTNDPYMFFGRNTPSVSDQRNAGVLESKHNYLHIAVGSQSVYFPILDPNEFPLAGTCPTCLFHDMGSLSTSGKDPVFWSHHANTDRLWDEWLKQPNSETASGHNENPTTSAWLESTYTFYRYDGILETIQVKDMLDTKKMGYTYAPAKNVWNATNYNANVGAQNGPRKLLSAELPPALTVQQLLAQYPGNNYVVKDLFAKMPQPVAIGSGISHWRIQRNPPIVPGMQEILMFTDITTRLDERAIVEVWINKPDVGIDTKLNWHYAGALSQLPLSPNAVGIATEQYSTSKNRPLQINVDLYNLGLLKATELLITLVPVNLFVDEDNNAFRAPPQFTTLTLGGAEIHQGSIMSYFND